MKFLLDVCTSSHSLRALLAELGQDVRLALDVDPRASDETLLAVALQEARVEKERRRGETAKRGQQKVRQDIGENVFGTVQAASLPKVISIRTREITHSKSNPGFSAPSGHQTASREIHSERVWSQRID